MTEPAAPAAMTREPIEGSVPVSIGRVALYAAPLNFGALKRLLPRVGSINGSFQAENLDALRDLIDASLRRNHPDLTSEWLEEWLDARNSQMTARQVMLASGMEVADTSAGEQKPAGENGQAPTGDQPTSI